MQRYLHEYGWKHTDFAPFSINAHANAAGNPFARLREPITEEDYKKARMISEPINLLDASPTGDGAAAVLIAPMQSMQQKPAHLIKVIGSASATDYLAVHDRRPSLVNCFRKVGQQSLCSSRNCIRRDRSF